LRHREQFLLESAALLLPLVGAVYRPTKDIDFLGLEEPDSNRMLQVFRELCALPVEPDELRFIQDTIRLEIIRKNHSYPNDIVKPQASLSTRHRCKKSS
jgi:hypothetical protein